MTILAFFHAVGVRLSHKHLVYGLATVFEMPWYILLLSMSRCLYYGRCLLLPHSSYRVVLLPPPMMLSLVPFFLGQSGLWYSVHCRIARCRIPLFILWFSLDHGLFYSDCPGVWSICLGLASALRSLDFLQALSCHDRFSYDLLVVYPGVLSCFIFDGLVYFCVFHSLFIVAVSRHLSSFRHQGSCWWWYPSFLWLANCLSYS